MIFLLASVASLLAADPIPLDMPRAQPYLVRQDARRYLEDRYNHLDLWVSRTVDGRWVDDEGRVFIYSTLSFQPPSSFSESSVLTRLSFTRSVGGVKEDDIPSRRRAIELISPIVIADEMSKPRITPHDFSKVEYWQGTNRTAIVCSFLPRGDKVWRLATWLLADEDDFDARLEDFNRELFEKKNPLWKELSRHAWRETSDFTKKKKEISEMERERLLLRDDARHSVRAYPSWRVTEADEFVVLDELPFAEAFIVNLTNEFSEMRQSYAATVPSPLDGTNTLCVARIFSSRERYIEALEADGLTNLIWTAAYWSPARRELVAYRPSNGDEALLKTIRHEAFHQYLTYACSAIAPSPWLNEGYAQYFEEGASGTHPSQLKGVHAYLPLLPKVLFSDYDEFYSGTDEERRIKYILALSVAIFIEHGAPKVRFQPFKDLKRDYISALLETKDMFKATEKAFKNKETLELFLDEWLEFWEEKGG